MQFSNQECYYIAQTNKKNTLFHNKLIMKLQLMFLILKSGTLSCLGASINYKMFMFHYQSVWLASYKKKKNLFWCKDIISETGYTS